MTNDYKKEAEIFDAAILIEDQKARESYLAKVCGNDQKLRENIDKLLKAHFNESNLLDRSIHGSGVTLDINPNEIIGTVIGRYKLLQQIGEGGFGIVYMAEQEHPIRRRVALKIIKLGMDTKQVVARFEAERQALAMMDHPNIAKVLDAGATDTGRPYFVMEYINGTPITEYVDQEKIGIEGRLKLFIQVCEAVQHAHQKGLIHRDIKPSNLIVNVHEGKVTPKVIDFGVAKAMSMALTEKIIFTQHGQLIGTPEYMSPEQADLKEKDIDTRADIYSLGVVLYELLAGTLPFEPETLREGGFAEIQRIIREEEAPHPSAKLSSLGEDATKVAQNRQTQLSRLVKSLHEELEWIPMMAIRKERDQRYKSAADLAQDVQNYLDGNPLMAGPESAAYKLKKFVKKRKGLVAAVLSIAGVLVISLIIISNLFVKSEQLRFTAEVSENKALEAKNKAEKSRAAAEVSEQKALVAKNKAELNNQTLMYAEYIDQAQESFKFGDLKRTKERLEECDPELRNWEWN
ncbi:MAG: serine/threonine protein kinase, partial [Planctomycetota bacterium]